MPNPTKAIVTFIIAHDFLHLKSRSIFLNTGGEARLLPAPHPHAGGGGRARRWPHSTDGAWPGRADTAGLSTQHRKLVWQERCGGFDMPKSFLARLISLSPEAWREPAGQNKKALDLNHWS